MLGPALVCAGLAAAAAGTARHGPAVLGRRVTPAMRRRWLIGGWALLALSVAVHVGGAKWRIALVAWFGLLAAGALAVTLIVATRPRWLLPATALLLAIAFVQLLRAALAG